MLCKPVTLAYPAAGPRRLHFHQDRRHQGSDGGCGAVEPGHAHRTARCQDEPLDAVRHPCAGEWPAVGLSGSAGRGFLLRCCCQLQRPQCTQQKTSAVGAVLTRPSPLSSPQVGLGEGFAPSAATAVLAKQVPSGERARAVSTVFGGLDVGSAVGLLLCGPLIRMYGWPSVFYLFAILGLVWCALWPLVKPETIDPLTAAQEKAQAEQDAAKDAAAGKYAPPPSGKMPWLKFMTSKAVWAIITVRGGLSYCLYFLC